MKIIELTVSKGRKVNIGNYQTRDYFCSLKAELEITDAEKIETIAEDMFSQCEKIIRIEVVNDKVKGGK